MQRIRRRRRLKKKPIIILVTCIVFLFIGVFWLTDLEKETIIKNTFAQELPVVEEEQVQVKTYETSLVMVGDALIHNSLYNDAYENKTYNFKKYLTYIKEYVKDFDLAYYNQETILGGTSIGLSSYPSFNSPQELGDAMIDAGFNLVSLATNHTLDRGEKAVKLSRQYWNKQEGVHAVGSYTSQDEKDNLESLILESNGITYAILNYTYGTNGIPVPSGKKYLVNLWDDTNNYEGYKKQVEKDINRLRNQVDILMVAMHWGREYTFEPTKLEKKTAKYLASLGVDIIIGTHPHVIQPVEYIDDTLVFYSLGNFISAQTSSSCSNYKCFIGLMSSLKITKTVTDTETTIDITDIKNELIYTYHKNYQDFNVIPFSNPDIKNYLKKYSSVYQEYAKIVESDDERIQLVPCSN